MNGRWRIELLGGLRAESSDRVVTRFRSRRTAALLAYLAFYRQRAHPRQVLIELLWPQWDAELGRHNLSVALSSLREQLETPRSTPAVIQADRFTVGLNPEAITTDVAQFEAALAAAAAAERPDQVPLLEQAVEGYGGPLLPGFYEDWLLPEHQRLEGRLLQALRELSARWAEAGELERAIRFARRAVTIDPLCEEALRELMRLLTAAGQIGAALREYRELDRLLKQELNAAPDPVTRALVEQLQLGVCITEASPAAGAEPEGGGGGGFPPRNCPRRRRRTRRGSLRRLLRPFSGPKRSLLRLEWKLPVKPNRWAVRSRSARAFTSPVLRIASWRKRSRAGTVSF
jgi:DNA-binding SARP family transcriptional activator